MKAHYYLAQAKLALRDFDGALESALRAHAICAESNDRSLANVTAVVLRCKKERWEERERTRLRETKDLEREVIELLGRDRDAMLAETDDGMEKQEIEEETAAKIERMKEIFEKARDGSEKKREVPDWAIDDISFGIMVDPVIVGPLSPVNAQHRPLNIYRQRLENHMSAPPSWSTSDDIPATLLPVNPSTSRSCDPTGA